MPAFTHSGPPTHATCPSCGGVVRIEAVKCRHCRHMIDGPPRRGAIIGADFWVPLAVVAGALVMLGFVLRPHDEKPPEAFQKPTVPLAIADPTRAPKPAVPEAGAPGALDPGATPSSSAADPLAAGGPAGAAPGGGDPLAPIPWQPRHPRPSAANAQPGALGGGPETNVPGASTTPGQPGEASAQRPPEPDEDSGKPARPRELRSPLFGYGMRLRNENGWRLLFSGTSRDALLRTDETARLQLWVDVNASGAKADGAACLAAHLKKLERRLRRNGTTIRGTEPRARPGRFGLTVNSAIRDASGKGPRRHAGRYFVAFVADQNLCHGFEGFAGAAASRKTRREVEEAFASFDVDGTTRTRATTEENHRQIQEAALGGNPAVLLDAGTSLAALWPEEAAGWRILGEAFMSGNRPAEALRAIARARKGRDPAQGDELKMNRFSLEMLAADGYARQKKWTEAERVLDAGRALIPDHPYAAYAEACFWAQRGKVDRAMDKLEAALRAWPAKATPPRFPHGLRVQVALASRDSRLANLRKDPTFEILLRRFDARARKADPAAK